MKTYKLEIIKTERILSEAEQTMLRKRLRHLLTKKGIISICLDNEYLFIEYDGNIYNPESIQPLLITTSYLLANGLRMAS